MESGGAGDATAFWRADPSGFLVAEEDGQPVGYVSCVRYDGAFAFFGLYLVVPGRRGRGVGGPLFAAMLERAGRRTVGLDGVPAAFETVRMYRGGAPAFDRRRVFGTTRLELG